MITNYFLIAFRNLKRYRFFSSINILGLAISMCVCMAVMMLVADQLMYDRYNTKRDRIFRIMSRQVDNNGVTAGGMDNASSPMTLRDELLDNYTGIEKVVRLKRGFGNNWMDIDGQDINIPVKGYFADPEVLDMFEYELEHGDPLTVLKNPFAVVLSHEAARKLFTEENPVGLTLKVNKDLYTVTGVLKKSSNKSHIVFDALASMATVKSLEASHKIKNESDNWFNFWEGWTYILANKDQSETELSSTLDKIYKQHIATSTNAEQYKAKFILQHLLDITPGVLVNNSIGPSMPWIIVYFLSGLAAIIMITSCFNFTNLSIARALTRAKEVGVRKVNGAGKSHILIQFLTESIFVAFISLLLAFFMVIAFKPIMLQLNFARMLQWDLQANYVIYGVFMLFAIIVGLLAGILPAALLSAFQPIKVLKKLSDVRLFSRLTLRRSLIVIQFTLSLIFILTIMLLYNQLDLFQSKDHGFSVSNNIVIRLNGTSAEKLKTSLSGLSSITSISAVSHLPATGESRGTAFKKEMSDGEWSEFSYFIADEDYLRTMKIKLIAGKYFASIDPASNRNFIVINEAAAKALHYDSPVDAIGQQLIYKADSTRKTIIGILADYNHQILFSEIKPLAIIYNPDECQYVHVKFTGNYHDVLKSVTKAWSSVNPDSKLDAQTLEEKITGVYDTLFGDLVNIVGVISFLAIFISCMGLMGMATYTTETRTKEISIRKVLGSENAQLVLLLSRGFLKLLSLAVLIGVPMAWLLNNIWLDMLPYRTSFDVKLIAIGVATMLILGGVTIASQTLRAVFINPVDNLRNE
ncbi:MAG: ABC transporter permease [Chryseolinea sp.]